MASICSVSLNLPRPSGLLTSGTDTYIAAKFTNFSFLNVLYFYANALFVIFHSMYT